MDQQARVVELPVIVDRTTAQTFVTATTASNNVVTYNPTIVVTLDSSVLAGTYTGTITQSVS